MLINDLSAKIAAHRGIIDAAVARVLDRSWLVLGPEVSAFEKKFADYVGARYCRTLANGTDALELALRSVGVGKNDYVATVANAGFYASTAILAIGAVPLYMDVDLDTRVVNLDVVKNAIDNGAKAIVVTHLYGLAVPDIASIATICRAARVPLVEDCAQAHGASIDGKRVGSFGDIGCFSFYPTKNLGALGDGGAIVTDDACLSDGVGKLRQYGWQGKYHVDLEGARNSRLDEMQAAVLSELLPHLDEWNSRRRQIAGAYSTRINHPSVDLPPTGDDSYVAHLYVIRVRHRDSLQNHLYNCDIATDVHYPVPDNRQPLFGGRHDSVHLPNTDILSREVLTLPCYPEMTDEQIQQVVAGVNGWQA